VDVERGRPIHCMVTWPMCKHVKVNRVFTTTSFTVTVKRTSQATLLKAFELLPNHVLSLRTPPKTAVQIFETSHNSTKVTNESTSTVMDLRKTPKPKWLKTNSSTPLRPPGSTPQGHNNANQGTPLSSPPTSGRVKQHRSSITVQNCDVSVSSDSDFRFSMIDHDEDQGDLFSLDGGDGDDDGVSLADGAASEKEDSSMAKEETPLIDSKVVSKYQVKEEEGGSAVDKCLAVTNPKQISEDQFQHTNVEEAEDMKVEEPEKTMPSPIEASFLGNILHSAEYDAVSDLQKGSTIHIQIPYFISNVEDRPWDGPHTALVITNGPDWGRYLHLPKNLSEKNSSRYAMRSQMSGKASISRRPACTPRTARPASNKSFYERHMH
jgi:hypothetical protein